MGRVFLSFNWWGEDQKSLEMKLFAWSAMSPVTLPCLRSQPHGPPRHPKYSSFSEVLVKWPSVCSAPAVLTLTPSLPNPNSTPCGSPPHFFLPNVSSVSLRSIHQSHCLIISCSVVCPQSTGEAPWANITFLEGRDVYFLFNFPLLKAISWHHTSVLWKCLFLTFCWKKRMSKIIHCQGILTPAVSVRSG